MLPLSSALYPQARPISKEELTTIRLATLHFDGTMESRKSNITGIKGRLFVAEPGDVVYSKIDVRNGAIGIVPDDFGPAAFTSEFPIYRLKKERAIAQYIQLIFRSASFRRTINGMVSGASGRKRVMPADLLQVEVPLPLLEVQQAIVAQWNHAQKDATTIEAEAQHLEQQAATDFLQALGLNARVTKKSARVFALQWSHIDRWGFDQCLRSTQQSAQASYTSVQIRSIAKIGSGGTPSRQIDAYYRNGTIPWVKTTEVRNGIILDTEEKLTELGLANSSARRYPAGSLVVAMYGQGATRGRTAKLGVEAATNQACCVLTQFAPGIDADFVWFYLMSQYEELRSLASGNNQPNLNGEMIASYPIPIPPLHIQTALVTRMVNARERADSLRAKAREVRDQARIETEAMILGIQPPPAE